MATSEQFSIPKYSRLDLLSFGLGLTTLIFPAVSVVYLITENGGPGYLQSLLNGIPFASISIIIGIISLVQRKMKNQAGNWMAVSGIVLGSLFLMTALVMVIVLLFPFLTGNAH